MSQLQIRLNDLTGKKIADLLLEHLENMNEITPELQIPIKVGVSLLEAVS